eukprot:c15121_g2_i1 orf=116-310(-)
MESSLPKKTRNADSKTFRTWDYGTAWKIVWMGDKLRIVLSTELLVLLSEKSDSVISVMVCEQQS